MRKSLYSLTVLMLSQVDCPSIADMVGLKYMENRQLSGLVDSACLRTVCSAAGSVKSYSVHLGDY